MNCQGERREVTDKFVEIIQGLNKGESSGNWKEKLKATGTVEVRSAGFQ